MTDTRIKEMSTDEYFYLTENLEIVDEASIRNGFGYLVYNRKKRLLDIVERVMREELTETERRLACDFWSDEYSLNEISQRNNIARSAIYRHIARIKEKLEASLKYVILYDSQSAPKSKNELMCFIKESQQGSGKKNN